MVKGITHYLRQAWKKPDKEAMHSRLIGWRKGKTIEKVEKPLRIDRARALGYKAKKGFVIARVKIGRGGRKRVRKGVKGRKTRKQTNRKTLKMNYKWVAETRAGRKFRNLEVLNSYWIGQDGKYYFYEVILVDPDRPEIKNDRTMNWVKKGKRAQRGKTSAARKSRGLRGKSPKKKVRPSLRARMRQGK
ncbi:50S ribosomal protein L15e [Candidatus Pacearchaeota archaeon CG10_big_fil_rev_8_21_14_0_10_35_219]|nr:50S ribosomal protein L15e [Candidatus Pacearchaeota archaeon]OIO42703.1 MAG: hypothetical protein AUJ63_02210 [Candidatus Pacearchaeota archaeon CG1_02_35_32]PIO08273.1 MAG: 50S ribosomal protein L15e [Candidatus Pacearchaeota archaeon CG10_big_fil_rev_8_21_14_0_10_35_219]PIY81874.1 MAG: 50S ribosomal protein L15e [Candidatus Pacearchaeota archaeon CG_4_10_14_0_8_um_filter_35_169]PIZ79385.1 MAG: 50S ribosomal protein L15e [Candidatus Pacearchaeota archaeon CG_4_10_14_0_2_um_filter_35_33]PJ